MNLGLNKKFQLFRVHTIKSWANILYYDLTSNKYMCISKYSFYQEASKLQGREELGSKLFKPNRVKKRWQLCIMISQAINPYVTGIKLLFII